MNRIGTSKKLVVIKAIGSIALNWHKFATCDFFMIPRVFNPAYFCRNLH